MPRKASKSTPKRNANKNATRFLEQPQLETETQTEIHPKKQNTIPSLDFTTPPPPHIPKELILDLNKEAQLHATWITQYLEHAEQKKQFHPNEKFYRFMNTALTKDELQAVFQINFKEYLLLTWQEAFTPLSPLLTQSFYDAIFGDGKVLYKHQSKLAKSVAYPICHDYATLIDDLQDAIIGYFLSTLPKRKQTINSLLSSLKHQPLPTSLPFADFISTLNNLNLQEPQHYLQFITQPDIFFKSTQYLKYLPQRTLIPYHRYSYDKEFNIYMPMFMYNIT